MDKAKKALDMDKIARALGAERGGRMKAGSGYFGAMQLLADMESRFKVPSGGGRRTDPGWTERRLLPLSRDTLRRLERITAKAEKRDGLHVGPMQIAALLLEKATRRLRIDEVEQLIHPRRRRRSRSGARARGRRTAATVAGDNRE